MFALSYNYFHRIIELLNLRDLETMKEKWWNAAEYKSQCDKIEDQSEGISMKNIGGVFIVIFVGIGIAGIILVFEYWWYRLRKTPKVGDVDSKLEGESNNRTPRNDEIVHAITDDSGIETTTVRARLPRLSTEGRY